MTRCFGTKTVSSKEYINKKSNLSVFCDIRKKYMGTIYPQGKEYKEENAFPGKFGYRVGNNIACVDNGGTIVRYNSNLSLLNLAKAFVDFRTDIKTQYTAQTAKKFVCSYSLPLKDANNSNANYSNGYNYHSPLLTTAEPGDTAQTREVQSWTKAGGNPDGDYDDDVNAINNRFAEVHNKNITLENLTYANREKEDEVNKSKFKNEKKVEYTQCPRRVGMKIGVIKKSEAPADDVDGKFIWFNE